MLVCACQILRGPQCMSQTHTVRPVTAPRGHRRSNGGRRGVSPPHILRRGKSILLPPPPNTVWHAKKVSTLHTIKYIHVSLLQSEVENHFQIPGGGAFAPLPIHMLILCKNDRLFQMFVVFPPLRKFLQAPMSLAPFSPCIKMNYCQEPF